MTAQKTQVILYFQPVLSTSLNNKHQSMLLRTLKCKGGFQHFMDNETQTKKSFVTAAVWLLPTKEGWPALVSMRMSPYSTVLLPQFTAQCEKLIHSLKILQRDEFQTVETPVTEFISKFICKLLHYLQTTKETGFASLLLYLTTLLRKWKRRREEKWNILQVVFTCRSPHILRKKKRKIFFLVRALRYLSWKIFSLKGRRARLDEQLYFSGHTYACNWVCDVTNTGQAGYLSDNHVNDWRDNLGMSEYSLCLRKWASPAYKTYRHQSWEPSLVRSESWLEGR